MKPPVWLQPDVVLAIHDAQLAEHGGAPGLRDAGALDSALARPQQLLAYGAPDLAELATAYAFGLLRNHPFVDGNKRMALVAAEGFLARNGVALMASDEDCVTMVLSAAAGATDEADFAAWVRENLDRDNR